MTDHQHDRRNRMSRQDEHFYSIVGNPAAAPSSADLKDVLEFIGATESDLTTDRKWSLRSVYAHYKHGSAGRDMKYTLFKNTIDHLCKDGKIDFTIEGGNMMGGSAQEQVILHSSYTKVKSGQRVDLLARHKEACDIKIYEAILAHNIAKAAGESDGKK